MEPDQYEYEIQAMFEYVFRKNGSPRNGYPCIIGSGPNTLILHYEKNSRQVEDGDLILMDCAAEFGYYSADITRTVPAGGKFTQEQREIYQIVLDAQKAGIGVIKPGNTLQDVTDAIDHVLTAGLIRLGLIKDKGELTLFTLHGYSHWLGLDVHDVGAYRKNNQDIPLQPGMVFTLEPGLYVRPAIIEAMGKGNISEETLFSLSQRITRYLNIGIRIEDDLLVTEEGCQNLTESVPREIEAIEALMVEEPQFIQTR
jgi:Xaa-Pro aminopeptidase